MIENDLVDKVAKVISEVIGEGGFALLVFDFNDPKSGTNVQYCSNAKRADVIAVMRKFIRQYESNDPVV